MEEPNDSLRHRRLLSPPDSPAALSPLSLASSPVKAGYLYLYSRNNGIMSSSSKSSSKSPASTALMNSTSASRLSYLGLLGLLAWFGVIFRMNYRLSLVLENQLMHASSLSTIFNPSTTDRQRAERRRTRAIVPWHFDGMGIHPERDRLVEWWQTHPEAPIGLSCWDHKTGQDNNGNNIQQNQKQKQKRRTAITTDTYTDLQQGLVGLEFPPPVFDSRIPVVQAKRKQVAFVVPFVEFQLPKIISLLFDHWSQFPPCRTNTQVQDADLVFFTEAPLSYDAKEKVLAFYRLLGEDKTGCFRSKNPAFLTLGKDSGLSHLEGAAFSFYELFRLLEQDYQAFILAEPDVAPIQANWLPALVEQSATVGCNKEQYWQIGSPPFTKDFGDVAGMLRERLDFHMNGNAIYALGCEEFEDYKCRVQTYYVPKDDCALVAGCQTHAAFEGGYDHALYHFRMQSDNYEYSRHILHKFHYSPFIKNFGEEDYTPEGIAAESPSTYFVHSKAIYTTESATILNRVSPFMIGQGTCEVPLSFAPPTETLKKLHRYVRSGEYGPADVLHTLCLMRFSKANVSPIHKTICALAKAEHDKHEKSWDARMPGKTYIWNIDMHGGPTNCDLPIITKAGGAVHAEIDGMCDFYGLCPERLKVLSWDGWKGYDPSEKVQVGFYNAYKNDPEFKRVDAFLCHHPVANCELFTPFGKPIIVHATTRLEFGRHDAGIDWRLSSGYDPQKGKQKWKKWISTLQELAKDKRNIIAANSIYDQHYIKFFTGIEDVEFLPSWCGESIGVRFCEDGWDSSVTSRSWFPTKPEVVIVPYRSNLDRTRFEGGVRQPEDHPIMTELRAAAGNGTIVKSMAELYGNGNPLNLLQHPALIIIPYQVSTMQIMELYRLNIPMFCPSLRLLKKWCQEHDLMWEAHYGWPEDLMPDSHPGVPDPNGHLGMDKYGKEWIEMFDYWMPKCDFYVFPHIHYFDSWEHFLELYQRLESTGDLKRTNVKMMKENQAVYTSLLKQWEGILDRVNSKAPIVKSSAIDGTKRRLSIDATHNHSLLNSR